jgi:hypothetical protein
MEILEIAKIVDYNASNVIDKIGLQNVEAYKFLSKEFDNTNVSENYLFQFAFSNYYQIDEARVGQDYMNNYFAKLETYGKNVNLDVEDICVALSYTKDPKGQLQPINYSYVSYFLNLIDETLPIWDKNLLKMFTCPEPYFLDTGKEIKYFELSINHIKKQFNEIIKLNLLSNAINLFDTKFKDNDFSTEKKIEFLFKAFYEIHFLEVLFPEEDKILDEDSLSIN